MRKPTSLPISTSPSVYVLHENNDWMVPLREAFDRIRLPYTEWFIDGGHLELEGLPPHGVFYNRMSASSHSRDHRFAVEMSEPLIAWLESHNRRVINGRRALQLEVRKFEQYLSLKQFGIPVPKTTAACGRASILEAAASFDRKEWIFKPNRGGKGLDVQLLRSMDEVTQKIDQLASLSLDGITLIQEYIQPAGEIITRLEFIGGKFLYAVEVDASKGFELCPADSCATGDAFCPVGDEATNSQSKFKVLRDFRDDELIRKLEAFFQANKIEVAAAEFLENHRGERFVYDINTNTNYNRQAERDAEDQKQGMAAIAELLQREFEKQFVSV